MDLNLEKKSTKSVTRVILIFLSVVIILTFFVSVNVAYSILRNDRIYKGIYVDNINASDLLPRELYDRLEAQYKNEYNNIKIKIKAGEYQAEYYLKDFDYALNIDDVVDEAFSFGRRGNIFNRLSEILNLSLNDKVINTEVSYSEEKVDLAVNSIYNQVYVPVEEPDFEIQNDRIYLKAGHNGKSIDKDLLKDEIIKFIKSRKNANVDIPIIVTEKAKVDLDSMYEKINLEPVNATAKVENGKLVIIPHKHGVKVDKEDLKIAVDKINNNENITEQVKVELIPPEITQEYMNKNLFKDVIASYATYFSTEGQANVDRAQNLKIAADKINGKILAPGDVFSFNEVVGERTEANGFKKGMVFEGGRVVEGIGGGICQVSSTLYNAVLKANLKIVERVNHMFTVDYVPAGLDATVAYGVIDFKFQNSTRWPIKIEAFMTENNQLFMRLIGTKEEADISVEMYTQLIKTIPFKTVYEDNPNLPEGTMQIKQHGKNGAVVDTYKIVKKNGVEISRTKITTSSYTPLDQIVVRGTGKVNSYQETIQNQTQDQDQIQNQEQIQEKIQEHSQEQEQEELEEQINEQLQEQVQEQTQKQNQVQNQLQTNEQIPVQTQDHNQEQIERPTQEHVQDYLEERAQVSDQEQAQDVQNNNNIE